MDQRQQQQQQQQQSPPHPFSRNTASPYNRTPFPPAPTQSPFPPATAHPPPTSTAPYAEHQRRPSDPPFYNAQRSFAQDGPPMGGPGHTRHQSASSLGGGTPVNRGMPPPSSPQQERQQSYGPSRAPLPGGSNFTGGRELPALGQRSGMSISDILGGPSVSREPAPQYGSPIATAGGPPLFGPARGSPRNQSAAPDYTAPFRRPQTPEHQRFSGPRDHRANSAGSPPNPNIFGTPESRQFGTQYRGQVAEERRDVRAGNPPSMPPRPNSQPTSYNPAPSRAQDSRAPLADFARRMDHNARPSEVSNRQDSQYARPPFGDRPDPRFSYVERERIDREAELREREREREINIQRDRDAQRDREIREQREHRERAEQERQQEYAHQLAQRNAQAYSRAPERDQPAWMRPQPVYEPSRAPYEQPAERVQQGSNGYEYPGTSAPSYGSHAAYASGEGRYPQASHSSHHGPPSQYEPSSHEQQLRLAQAQQQRQQQGSYGTTPSAAPYSNESPARRSIDDAQQMQQQRSFLGVQEINRKGRLSPLPQAVQGAQSQMSGPGGEPSIKNEFGRMFSGIGSGVGAMGAPSPVHAGPSSLPFSSAGQIRRDDAESLQNSPVENGAQKMLRTASMGGNRRRKLKDEESRPDEEGSTGRRTPSGRGKKAKTHHHHHHHHHHHRNDAQDSASSPQITPFKHVKGTTVPSPPGVDKESANLHHHHVPLSRPHHHHHHTSAKTVPQINPQISLPNVTIVSSAVLDSVKSMPRRHLGHCYYDATLKRAGNSINGIKKGTQGYSSTPKPLPLFDEDQYNCTYTVKVPRVHLTRASLQEITNRKALWGTDVYTDDSDVIAAAIHSGWFRGAWDPSVDVSLLGLELPGRAIPKIFGPNGSGEILERPPPDGPNNIPANHDVHIDIIILPLLEGYSSTIRFGIKSREWGLRREGHKSQHDGLSFMINKVSFVTSDGGLTGIRTRKKIAQQKTLAARTAEERKDAKAITEAEPGSQYEESFERGNYVPAALGDMRRIGTGSWWQKPQPVLEPASPEREDTPVVETDAVSPGAEVKQAPVPRTPPRHEPPRHYVPLDPPIPSPISVIDPQGDMERVAEMAESVNVTPTKATNDHNPAQEEEISPPRPIPDAAASPPRITSQRSGLEKEIITTRHGFGGDIEVKREAIVDSRPLSPPAAAAPPASDPVEEPSVAETDRTDAGEPEEVGNVTMTNAEPLVPVETEEAPAAESIVVEQEAKVEVSETAPDNDAAPEAVTVAETKEEAATEKPQDEELSQPPVQQETKEQEIPKAGEEETEKEEAATATAEKAVTEAVSESTKDKDNEKEDERPKDQAEEPVTTDLPIPNPVAVDVAVADVTDATKTEDTTTTTSP